jgi:hypothetical protein
MRSSLPVNYAIELGFFLAVGVLRLRQVSEWQVEPVQRVGCMDAGHHQFPGRHIPAFEYHQQQRPGMEMLPSGTTDPAAVGATWFMIGGFLVPACRHNLRHRPGFAAWLAALLILGVLELRYQVFMLRINPVPCR